MYKTRGIDELELVKRFKSHGEKKNKLCKLAREMQLFQFHAQLFDAIAAKSNAPRDI